MADLIEVAELDTGKRELQAGTPAPASLARRGARPLFATRPPQKQIRIEVSAFADLSFMQADRRAVRSILDNLLIERASLYARRTAKSCSPPKRSRTSCSSPCAITAAASRPIASATSSTASIAFSDTGTGMGLALVRRLVESLGGQIAVESRLGHGTTFRFTLPVAVVETAPPPGRGGLMAEIELERQQEPAKLRIYLGAAPGVGKTYHMLNDALLKRKAGHRRRDRAGGDARPRRRPRSRFAISKSFPCA